MSTPNKQESWVRSGLDNHVVGKDTTITHEGGSSTTIHQRASENFIGGPSATVVTGVTENHSDGTSTNKSR